MSARLVLVDDDPNLLKVLAAVLRDDGHEVRAFPTAAAALDAVGTDPPDALVTDLQMPGIDGIDLLRRMRAVAPEVPVVLLTAFGSIARAVEAMKSGAYDFLTKPVENERFLVTVRNAVERGRLSAEVRRLRDRVGADLGATIVGDSSAVRLLRDTVLRVAARPTTVLVTGETGVGKEVVARAIHAASPRAAGPFVVAHCAAMPETLVESELFGHVRGAFTGAVRDRKGRFEAAGGGTLFLDEIGEVPPQVQVKLLHAIEARAVTPLGTTREVHVDARIIAATNRNIEDEVRAGRFREDLYYRLKVVEILVPPLCERKEDIPSLAAHLLARIEEDPPEVSDEALRALLEHDWPGNVRELAHVLERAIVFAGEGPLLPEHLGFAGRPAAPNATGEVGTAPGAGVGVSAAPGEIEIPPGGLDLEILEKGLIERALARTAENRTRAARLLGITRSALLYRMEKHGMR